MRRGFVIVLLLAVAAWGQVAQAALLSREFQFKTGVILEIGEATEDGLRIDNIRFDAPSKVSGQLMRVGGAFQAEVAVSNGGTSGTKCGIAIALYDDAGRLVGAASGGSKIGSIKPGRQKSFTLVFDGVNAQADLATRFHIALESKP